MHFSLLDTLPWAIALLVHLTLLFVLIGRGRWHQFPILTVWIAFMTVRTGVLFPIYMYASRNLYALVWVTGSWIDFVLQLGVVFEIARIVLRPTGTWVRDARAQFVWVGLAGAAVAALVALGVYPPAWSVPYAWELRGNLFTSLVICELFIAISFTANRLGLGWRNHVMALGQGLLVWTSVAVVTTALESFWGTRRFYLPLDRIGRLTYIAAICWITIQLWRQEPERQPISSDLQEYILALHKRVEYDLRRLDAGH